MFFDTHLHSYLSPDSQMEPEKAIRILAKKGLGCCFTEHVDFITPLEGLDVTAPDKPQGERDFLVDLNRYPQAYLPLKSDSVLTGIEIGLCAAYKQLNEQVAALDGLDYVIGSIHCVDGLDIYTVYVQKTEAPDPYQRMLEYTYEMIVLNDFFDSLGHIDYISRYSPLTEKNVWYDRYAAAYDAVFRALAERDKSLEINTARFANPAAVACMTTLCHRFHDLGGRFVTIGSDAHQSNALGRYFKQAKKIAENCGLIPVYYRERKRYVCN